MIATTTIALNMKMPVATMDRAESRAMPHTPWPEVHPPPYRAPKPTRTPAVTIRSQLAGICGTGNACPNKPSMIGATIKPAMKQSRQSLSPAGTVSTPPNMPLIPAIRPFNSINNADASPVNPPPIRAEIGSNAVIAKRNQLFCFSIKRFGVRSSATLEGLSRREGVFIFKLRECIERMGRIHHSWACSHVNCRAPPVLPLGGNQV